MKSIGDARFVLVADENGGQAIAAALRRMEPRSIAQVATLEAARELCAAGAIDACLVVVQGAVPDIRPRLTIEAEAPGIGDGIPSLLLTDVITPYVAKAARRSGYVAAIPLRLTPQLMHRRIRALLQKSGRGAERRGTPETATQISAARAARTGVRGELGAGIGEAGKFKLQ